MGIVAKLCILNKKFKNSCLESMLKAINSLEKQNHTKYYLPNGESKASKMQLCAFPLTKCLGMLHMYI